jgi:hypothetical protein
MIFSIPLTTKYPPSSSDSSFLCTSNAGEFFSRWHRFDWSSDQYDAIKMKVCKQTITMSGTCPISLVNSCGSPPFILYSSVAVIRPLYEQCLSLHSAGNTSRFPFANLSEGGLNDLSRRTSLILISSLFLRLESSLSSPSRYVLVPMSRKPWATNPSGSNSALKDSI